VNGPNGVAGSSGAGGTAGATSGGGLSAGSGGVSPNNVTLANTIVARNTAAGAASDVSGSVDPNSVNNLIGTGGAGGLTDGTNGNLVGVTDPRLGTLADNGGPTQTIALESYSPAIDAGDNSLAIDVSTFQPLTTDQRGTGYARIQGGTVDIGAYESPYHESLVVTTLADEDDGTSTATFGTGTSLREAINWANAHPGADTITFAPALAGGVITLGGTELPVITDDVTILGSHQTIDANHLSRVLEVSGGVSANLSDLVLVNGSAREGGGIFNAGNLTLSQVTLYGNYALSDGGGIENDFGATLQASKISVTWNSSTNFGGGIANFGTLQLSDSTVAANSTYYHSGAGLDNANGGDATLTRTTFSQNRASIEGGVQSTTSTPR
jgi:CSLREA domain-containing protein